MPYNGTLKVVIAFTNTVTTERENMFVAIQKIQLKKPKTNGTYKVFKTDSVTISFNGVTKTHYSYNPDYKEGQFERPHREAYKISVHQNYRENGKVRAKQCVIGTLDYYIIADYGLCYEDIEAGLDRAAVMFGDSDKLYDMIETKTAPLIKKIQREYHKSEEYKTVRERERVQKAYQKAKAAFAKRYSVDESEYDYCFDVFGHVMNQAYLDEIKQRAESYSSYYDFGSGNYDSGYAGQQDYSGYFNSNSGNYTEDEKKDLKKFYKALCLKFHPDMNPDKDTTKEMQLLNKLKEEWGL